MKKYLPKNVLNSLQYIVVLVIIVYLYNKFKKRDDNFMYENINLINRENNALNEEQIAHYSNMLLDSMKRYGTNHEAINSIYDKLNTDDKNFIRVFNHFGKKRYLLGEQTALLGYELNLYEWLKSELNTTTAEKVVFIRWENKFKQIGLI